MPDEPVVPQEPDNHDPEFLRAFAKAIVDKSERENPRSFLSPGTVVGGAPGIGTGALPYLLVHIDGDDNSTVSSIPTLIGMRAPGTRVMVLWDRPHGAYVMGTSTPAVPMGRMSVGCPDDSGILQEIPRGVKTPIAFCCPEFSVAGVDVTGETFMAIPGAATYAASLDVKWHSNVFTDYNVGGIGVWGTTDGTTDVNAGGTVNIFWDTSSLWGGSSWLAVSAGAAIEAQFTGQARITCDLEFVVTAPAGGEALVVEFAQNGSPIDTTACVRQIAVFNAAGVASVSLSALVQVTQLDTFEVRVTTAGAVNPITVNVPNARITLERLDHPPVIFTIEVENNAPLSPSTTIQVVAEGKPNEYRSGTVISTVAFQAPPNVRLVAYVEHDLPDAIVIDQDSHFEAVYVGDPLEALLCEPGGSSGGG